MSLRRALRPLHAAPLALFLALSAAAQKGPAPAAPTPAALAAVSSAAVVVVPFANLLVRPETLAPVDDQAVLGETVETSRAEGRFLFARLRSGSRGWIEAAAVRPGVADP